MWLAGARGETSFYQLITTLKKTLWNILLENNFAEHKHITIRVASMLHRSFALPIFPDETFQLEVMQRDEVVLRSEHATHATHAAL